jgi:flavorubredoxin
MWRSTESMIKQLVEVLEKEGIDAPVYNLVTAESRAIYFSCIAQVHLDPYRHVCILNN